MCSAVLFMMYRRYKRRYRRRYGRRYRRRRRSSKAMFVAKKALRLAQQPKMYKDYYNTSAPMGSIATNYVLDHINVMQQGTTAGTRIGNRITITNINVNFCVNVNTNVAVCRVVLLWFKNPYGVAPLPGRIFEDVTLAYGPITPYSKENAGSFQILMDRKFMVDTNWKSTKSWHFKWHGSMKVEYDSNVGDSTDIITNSLIVFACSSNNASTPFLKYYARINYIP